ncbi:MAG: hypothetical protein R8P61_33825 [Bacteroidia bacterium]|nr:hypothetical protein [Bacteroidia bacterium]
MKNYIILRNMEKSDLIKGIYDLEDLAVCHDDGELKTFTSSKQCREYMDQEAIKGSIVKMNLKRSENLI